MGAEQWPRGMGTVGSSGVCVTLQKALEHMETTHLGSLSGRSSFEEATHDFKVVFLFFFFPGQKTVMGSWELCDTTVAPAKD